MPVIKSAKKKLRQDIKRENTNNKLRELFKSSVKKARRKPTEKNVREAIKIIDKTAKKKIIHKNKAARIKSALDKLLNTKNKVAKKNPSKKTSSKA